MCWSLLAQVPFLSRVLVLSPVEKKPAWAHDSQGWLWWTKSPTGGLLSSLKFQGSFLHTQKKKIHAWPRATAACGFWSNHYVVDFRVEFVLKPFSRYWSHFRTWHCESASEIEEHDKHIQHAMAVDMRSIDLWTRCLANIPRKACSWRGWKARQCLIIILHFIHQV